MGQRRRQSHHQHAPDSDDMHQVRREALAGVLALKAAALAIDLSNAVVILRNDAVGALLSEFRKGTGSFSSTFLQHCAMRSCMTQRRERCQTLLLHAPGRVLVDEGVDEDSRDGALEVAGPVNSARVRSRALALAASCCWTLSVDAFASESNSLLPRFFAWYAEPAAEVEDAFTAPSPDWGCWALLRLPCVRLHTLREALCLSSPAAAQHLFGKGTGGPGPDCGRHASVSRLSLLE